MTSWPRARSAAGKAGDVVVDIVRLRPGERSDEAETKRHGLAIVRAGAGRDGTLVGMSEVTIHVRENGPYKIAGPVTIVDSEGREFVLPVGSAVALCRCGHSSTKPYCDATHKRVGFVAEETAPRVGLSRRGAT